MNVSSIYRNCGKRSISWALTPAMTFLLAIAPGTARAQTSAKLQVPSVILPLVQCWYRGKVAYYIQTEASDQGLATQQEANYVPLISNAISGGAVDDIYHITNSTREM